MPQHLHSRKQLEIQVDDLQRQLAEMQELLHSIRSGEVDALVVPGPKGPRIYSLTGAEQPYRVLIEEMSEGAATLASDGTVLYCNRRLADLVRAPLESVIGSAFPSFLAPADRPSFMELLECAQQGRTQGQVTCRHGGSDSVLHLSMKPLPPGRSGRAAVIVVDISERVAAQQRAESRLSLLLDSTAEGLFGMDLEGNCTFANRACLDMLGYPSLEAVLGRQVHSIARHSHADGTALAAKDCPIHLALGTGAGIHSEHECFGRADGTSFPVEYWSHPVTRDGKLIGAVLAFIDISERHEAMQALKQSEEKYRSLTTHIPDVVWTIDASLRVVFVTANIEQVSGFTAADLYEKGNEIFLKSLRPEDVSRVAQARQALFSLGTPYDVEYRIQRKDGEWAWVHDRAIGTYEKNGTRYADGLLSDITRRRRDEQALRESEQKYRTLIETTRTGYVVIDENGCVIDANAEYARLTGHPVPAQILGRNVTEWIVPSDVARGAEAVRRCAQEGHIRDFEVVHIVEQGKRTPIEINGTVIPRAGGVQMLGLVRDITGRKQAEHDRAFLASIVESSEDAIVGHTPDGNIASWNHGAEALFGYSPVEVIGKPVSMLIAPEEAEQGRLRVDAVGRDGKAAHLEGLGLKKSGDTVPVSVTLSPIKNAAGLTVGSAAIIRDISERKRAEHDRAFLASIVESSDDAIIGHTLEGNIASWNRGAEALFGYSPVEVIGKPVSRFIAPEEV